MSNIQTIYDRIYNDSETKNPKAFIDIYESNKLLIENQDTSISNPDYSGIMRLTSDYGLSLSHYGSSKKAIPYLDKAIKFFDDWSKSQNNDLTKVSMYETLVWTRGVENYNQKNYFSATKDFDYLVKSFPENDKYRNWLAASKTISLKKYLFVLWFIAGVCLILNLLFDKGDKVIQDLTLYTGVIAIGLALAVEIVCYRIKTKIKG